MGINSEQLSSELFLSRRAGTQALSTISEGTALLGGRYVVRSLLGRGGFAAVFLAHDELRHEDVALKIAEAGLCDPETARAVLEHESRVYSRIHDYQHVLRVHDLQYFPWRNSGLMAMTMELAKGGPFRRWLLQHKDDHYTRVTQGLEYFKQMCVGVSAIHKARVLHLDLKPDNFLFVGCLLKVSDFGAARFLQTLQLSSSMPCRPLMPRLGTPPYMSPEQFIAAHPDDLDERADIYALGCIAYEIFHPKCHPPFGGTEDEIRERHLHLTPPPLVGVDANVARVVARCLEKI
jgi:serine/threonine protein kinase